LQVLANSFKTDILNPIGYTEVGTIHRSPNDPIFIFKIYPTYPNRQITLLEAGRGISLACSRSSACLRI
jgi:hypothetical protein